MLPGWCYPKPFPNQISMKIFRLLKMVMDFLEFLLDQTVGANTNLASVNLILARSKKHFQVQNFWRKIKLKIGTNSKMKMVKHTNIRIIAMDVSHVTHQVCMYRGFIFRWQYENITRTNTTVLTELLKGPYLSITKPVNDIKS